MNLYSKYIIFWKVIYQFLYLFLFYFQSCTLSYHWLLRTRNDMLLYWTSYLRHVLQLRSSYIKGMKRNINTEKLSLWTNFWLEEVLEFFNRCLSVREDLCYTNSSFVVGGTLHMKDRSSVWHTRFSLWNKSCKKKKK